jgi:RNA polymerase sigma factor (TIGR02999 family)
VLHPVSEPAAKPFADLYAELYPELQRIARARLRDSARDGLLDTTELVHASFERVAASHGGSFPGKPAFLAYASRVMRSVVVDLARERMSLRQGGGADHVTLNTHIMDGVSDAKPEAVRVHDALEMLHAIDERMAQVVEMRYFGGLAADDIAQALGVSLRTVERSWEKARAFLHAQLSEP